MLCKETCTGCGACENVCPVGCIKIIFDEFGNSIPEIDKNKCISCKKCEQVCPILNDTNIIKKLKDIKVYRCHSNNSATLHACASGGMFTEIAIQFIEQGGYVCGVKLDKDFVARYTMISDKKDIAFLQSSKYVQSITGNIYKRVEERLQEDKPVFFCGLPCHVAGLYQYLGADYANLFTADIVCHGTSSSTLFQKYIQYTEDKLKGKISHITQTDKTKGWNILIPRNICISLIDNRKIYRETQQDSYLSCFLSNLFFKPVCYECKFAKLPRVADITLGDFFGIGTVKKIKDLNLKGESMLMCNTEKGKYIIEEMKERIFFEERDLKEALYYNHNLWQASSRHPKWKEFRDDMLVMNYEKLEEKYYRGLKNRFKRYIRKFIKSILGYKGVAKLILVTYRLKGIIKQVDNIIDTINKEKME